MRTEEMNGSGPIDIRRLLYPKQERGLNLCLVVIAVMGSIGAARNDKIDLVAILSTLVMAVNLLACIYVKRIVSEALRSGNAHMALRPWVRRTCASIKRMYGSMESKSLWRIVTGTEAACAGLVLAIVLFGGHVWKSELAFMVYVIIMLASILLLSQWLIRLGWILKKAIMNLELQELNITQETHS